MEVCVCSVVGCALVCVGVLRCVCFKFMEPENNVPILATDRPD